jgi:uncharacterized protein YndB with AHSA1/START domain
VATTDALEARRMPSNNFHFVERWEVPAPRERVYAVLSDGKLLPDWWRDVCLEAESLDSGEARVGSRVRVTTRGALPYRLRFVVAATELSPDRTVEVTTQGDLRGVWRAELSDLPNGQGTRVDIDWRVTLERPLIRFVSPLLRWLLGWNHNWTSPRGEAGLTAYLASRDVSGISR